MSWKMSRALEAYFVVLLVVEGFEAAAVVVMVAVLVVLVLLVFTCENGLGDREGKVWFCSPIVGGL